MSLPETPCSFPVESSPPWASYSAFIGAEAEASPRMSSSRIKLLQGPQLQRWSAMSKSGLLGYMNACENTHMLFEGTDLICFLEPECFKYWAMILHCCSSQAL